MLDTVSFAAGFITSLLAGLGIGGGGLLIIYLAFFTQTEQLSAQGINLIFFIFSSAASMLIHIKKRRIPFAAVGILSLFGAVGAALGSVTAMETEPSVIRCLFGGLLIFSGTASIFK